MSKQVVDHLIFVVNRHLYMPIIQKFNQTVESSSPENIRQRSATLLMTLQSLNPQMPSKQQLPQLQKICSIRTIADYPALANMHYELALQYLNCITRAYIPIYGLSTEKELNATRDAFKEVFTTVFASLDALDNRKIAYIRLCIKLIDNLSNQIDRVPPEPNVAAGCECATASVSTPVIGMLARKDAVDTTHS